MPLAAQKSRPFDLQHHLCLAGSKGPLADLRASLVNSDDDQNTYTRADIRHRVHGDAGPEENHVRCQRHRGGVRALFGDRQLLRGSVNARSRLAART